MSIEVKQLIIKSTMVNGGRDQEHAEQANIDLDELKEQVMEACKELIAESLSELQER